MKFVSSVTPAVAVGKTLRKCNKYLAAIPGATQSLRKIEAAPVGSVSSIGGLTGPILESYSMGSFAGQSSKSSHKNIAVSVVFDGRAGVVVFC